jgi:hypothetical protein
MTPAPREAPPAIPVASVLRGASDLGICAPATAMVAPSPAAVPLAAAGDRHLRVDGCRTCELTEGRLCPPHDASTRCESGRRTHCSCEGCF